MYYYKGEELGSFKEAKETILADRNLTRELIEDYLFNAFDERYLSDMIVDATVDGGGITDENLVEDALSYMDVMWCPEEGREGLGYFQFDDKGEKE